MQSILILRSNSPGRLSSVPSTNTARSGRIIPRLVLALAVVSGGGLGGWYLLGGSSEGSKGPIPVTAPVKVGPFVQEVVERGEIQSATSVEIRCKVRSRNSSGITILEIIPEGTYVIAGKVLVRLDDSTLQQELLQQEIICNNSDSNVIEATADVAAAQVAFDEYETGTFNQEEEQLESAEFVAKEALRRAEETLRYSARVAKKGYVSQVQLEADRFAVEKSRKELDVSQTKLRILREFTKKKITNKLQAAIKTSKARLRSRENSYKLDLSRREQIIVQIDNCTIKAPSAGQVVYGNDSLSRSSSNGDVLIAEGRPVRERQVIIRLPDPKSMQVIAKINESRIDRVKPGMITKVRLDAFPDLELVGVVSSVSEYPIPQSNRWLAHIKEYSTEITIERPPKGLRSGMTAQVAVQVEHLDNAMLVPPHAVFEKKNRYFCLVDKGETGLEAREVQIGSVNETYVVVESGLTAGDQVVLDPQIHQEGITLPAIDATRTASRVSADSPSARTKVTGTRRLASSESAGE